MRVIASHVPPRRVQGRWPAREPQVSGLKGRTPMALSASRTFLVNAYRKAGNQDYFRWRDVGTSMGYSEAQSLSAVQSLDEHKLLILLVGGDARLLSTGRDLASRLEAKGAGGPSAMARASAAPRGGSGGRRHV